MEHELTKGPVMKTMLLFAVPMILGDLLQQCYNIADTLIVGRFLGADALAAVGSAFALMTFLTSILLGLAMGSGTEVAKDAASMILADDNFATIVGAVVNGRSVYTNIKNAINFLLSGNMAGILCVLFTSILALPVPFAPVHLLFINLLTDSLPAIAIGVEPASGDLLDQKPRDPGEPILTRDLLLRIFLYGALIACAAMAALTAAAVCRSSVSAC